MPEYDSRDLEGRAAPFAPCLPEDHLSRSLRYADPIADLLEQVASEVEDDSSAERWRAEARLADHRLVEQVRFEMRLERTWGGVAYHRLFDDLWLYSLPVIKAFLRRNALGRVRERYVPEYPFTMRSEDMVVLANSDDERTGLALDIIGAAVEHFRDKAVAPSESQWRASSDGASLRTYFIGTCALVYPRAYEKWSKTRKGKLELLASQYDINFDNIGAAMADRLADPAALAGIRVDLKRIIDTATPTTKLIIGLLAEDMTQVQIAAELGLTVKAVNRRLAHFRQRALHPARPRFGRQPVGSNRTAAA